MVMLAVAGVLTVAVVAAAASPLHSAAGLPAMPQADESRCAPVSLSRHLVNIGDRIEASAGPATPDCGGPASTVTWSWPDDNPDLNQIEGLVKARACPMTSSHCAFRARLFTPAGQWEGICISGEAPQGAWTSCESYAVRTGSYFLLVGTIFNLPSAKPVTVHLSGPGGRQTTTTDGGGVWRFAVRRGRYMVSFRAGRRAITRHITARAKPGTGVTLNISL